MSSATKSRKTVSSYANSRPETNVQGDWNWATGIRLAHQRWQELA